MVLGCALSVNQVNFIHNLAMPASFAPGMLNNNVYIFSLLFMPFTVQAIIALNSA
jgi:hypothetical protein